MFSDNLESVSTSAGVLGPFRAETGHPLITAGIIEQEEEGMIILAPANGNSSRRILHVNSYGGRLLWERIKNGLVPSHQLLGCLQLVRMGYEVALAEPLQHFYLYRKPFPHDLKLLKRTLSWLGKDGILFSGHTLLYWLPILKSLGVIKSPVVSLVYAREELDWARSHTGILALTPAAAEHAKKLAPQAKVAHLGWGVDVDFFQKIPYSPEWFLSCGIANRDFRTLSAAAAKSRHAMKVICPGLPAGLAWPPHVTLVDGGPGWLTDKTKTLTARDLINDYFPHSAGTLIIMKNDPTQYTANGFTNLMEAMAVGQPVIVTRTGALPGEIDVEKTGCGLHVPPDDPDALADALELISSDVARAQAMGEKGRTLVEERYNIDRYARDLHTFFESL